MIISLSLFVTLSHACVQRDGGLAQGGLPQMFMRAINVQFRTKFSAGLLPPLRQTARCRLASLSLGTSLSSRTKSMSVERVVVSTTLSGCTPFSKRDIFPTTFSALTHELHSCRRHSLSHTSSIRFRLLFLLQVLKRLLFDTFDFKYRIFFRMHIFINRYCS